MKMLDTVVLVRDVPGHDLRAGDVGTIVEVYSRKAVEVEFVTPGGGMHALVTLETRAIRKGRATDVMTVRPAARWRARSRRAST
jgi:hypothetical protein